LPIVFVTGPINSVWQRQSKF